MGFPVTRTVRHGACALAAVALLVQLLASPPLAMRMLSDMAGGGWLGVLCSSGRDVRPVPAPQSPAVPHAHDHCLLCQMHPPPLALAAAAGLVPAAATLWRQPAPVGMMMVAPVRPFAPYSPRAPPAFG